MPTCIHIHNITTTLCNITYLFMYDLKIKVYLRPQKSLRGNCTQTEIKHVKIINTLKKNDDLEANCLEN